MNKNQNTEDTQVFLNFIKKTESTIKQSNNLQELEYIRIKFLGKKGYINQQIMKLHNLKNTDKVYVGTLINQAKENINKLILEKKFYLQKTLIKNKLETEHIDITLPGKKIDNGRLHPITYTIQSIESFFRHMGFITIHGPEIEDVYHNFESLNMPSYHPARSEHDTFWLDEYRLLRTQTSGIQTRIIKKQKPPIRIISPGKVYRNDYDKHHTPMFHQIEGLIIDNNISFANLKNILYDFLHNFFQKKINIRFRPSYFPFTEPSAEIDVMHKNNWLEILGCGMVHTDILNNANIDPEKFSGFAFGIGIERLTMLRYNTSDIRTFFENDLRFLKQFR